MRRATKVVSGSSPDQASPSRSEEYPNSCSPRSWRGSSISGPKFSHVVLDLRVTHQQHGPKDAEAVLYARLESCVSVRSNVG